MSKTSPAPEVSPLAEEPAEFTGDASGLSSKGLIDDEKPSARRDSDRTGSILAGYSVLTKSMLGSGLFFMAYACAKFGIIAAGIMIFVAGAVTWVSLRALSELAIEFKSDDPSFYSISMRIIPGLKWAIDIAVILSCFGAATGYVITAGDLLSKGLINIIKWDSKSFSVDSTKIVIQSIMILSLAGLGFMREISGTKYANLFGLTSLFYIVVTTFVYSDMSMASPDLLYMENFLSAMGTFPTFIFAFACQMNVFQIANELKNPTVKRMDVITMSSTLTGLIIYLPIMIFPVLTFGKDVSENYLNSLDSHKIPVQIAYILAALSVSISYVLQIHPLRRSILSMYYRDRKPGAAEERRNRIIVVSIVMLATFGVAVGVRKIDIVTNFTGLLGGNTMGFVMPSLLYLRYYGIRRNVFSIMVACVLVFSLLLYPLCLTGIIYDIVKT